MDYIFLKLKNLVEQEKIKPVIDRIYPLNKMAKTHTYVELGHKIGV
ncbi:zinc-binding dehydrogenase [Winogradskyella pulchriflava]|uniref:Zinc-binding dehydrogenase n=1 Tax=Winogradskyella pulchriflava TaxID=1110688 RepID=A0ABV6Q9D0_9FLAO